MRFNQRVASILFAFVPAFSLQAAVTVNLSTIPAPDPATGLAKGGVTDQNGTNKYGRYFRPLHKAGDKTVPALPINVGVTNDATVSQTYQISLRAIDIYGKPLLLNSSVVVDVPANSTVNQKIECDPGMGAFKVYADIQPVGQNGLAKSTITQNAASIDVVTLVPLRPRNVKDGYFMLNGTDPSFIDLGYDYFRCNLKPDQWGAIIGMGGWPWPCEAGSPYKDAEKGDLDAFLDRARRDMPNCFSQYPEVVNIEYINEPWIYGWRWAGSAEELRMCYREFAKIARAQNPTYKISGVNSTFLYADVMMGDKDELTSFDGLSNHPYDPSGNPEKSGIQTIRAGDWHSDADMGMTIAKHNNWKRNWITEGTGASEKIADGLVSAQLCSGMYLQVAFTGWFCGGNESLYGTGPGKDAANTAIAMLSYMISDRALLTDIWPYSELLWGGIFGNPIKYLASEGAAIKSWPRADWIQARWDVVPVNGNDKTLVAALFAYTGENNLKTDNFNGTKKVMTIDATDLLAADMSGQSIVKTGATLVIPLGSAPCYIWTDKLTVAQFRDRLRSAKIANITPVNMYALSLGKPANVAQEMTIRVENQMPFEITGTLSIEPLGGVATSPVPFTIPEGRLAAIKVQWPAGISLNANNVYGVKMSATVKDNAGTEMGTFSRQHLINSAVVAKVANGAITVNNNLDDWAGITPVSLDSKQCQAPNESDLSSMISAVGTGTIFIKFFAAYDDTNVYFAAAVKESSTKNLAGSTNQLGPIEGLENCPNGIVRGLPGGICTVQRLGDALCIAVGTRARVPKNDKFFGRQFDDPWCWKGYYSDADYLYTAHLSTKGDMLIQNWTDASPRRWGYQTDELPEHKIINDAANGAKVVITPTTGSPTIYEISIPRKLMPTFDPTRTDVIRIAFDYANDEAVAGAYYGNKIDQNLHMQYTWGYGVFDHWNKSLAAFGPSWNFLRPAETFWSIQGGTPTPQPTFDGDISNPYHYPKYTPTIPPDTDVKREPMRIMNSAVVPVGTRSVGEKIYGRSKR